MILDTCDALLTCADLNTLHAIVESLEAEAQPEDYEEYKTLMDCLMMSLYWDTVKDL